MNRNIEIKTVFVVKQKVILLLLLQVLLCGVGLLFSIGAHGQSAKNTKLYKESVRNAEEYWENEQYFEAAKYYQQAVQVSPDDIRVTYQLAECHRFLFNYTSAEKEYGKVYYADAQHYPAALFYYASMQKMNGKYADAISNFNLFVESAEKINEQNFIKKNSLISRAKLEKTGCEFALLQVLLPWREFQFSHLPVPIASKYHDYAPIIADNDSILVFTSGRENSKGNQIDTRLGESFSDLYRFSFKDSAWEKNDNNDLFELVNTKFSDGAGTFNKNKDKFYYTSCHEENTACKIYVVTLKAGKWTEPVILNSYVNIADFDARQPALSSGGDTLFFVSNRPGGLGMNDIWFTVSAGNDNWGPAVNMGNKVNTPLQELSPFYDLRENILFFASDGHKGLGGLDIFMFKGHIPNERVVNIGPPFNSNSDDCFFVMGKEKGYLASNRTGGAGNFDIYSFQIESHELILATINNNSQKDKTDLTYLDVFDLEYLPEKDKLAVDRIISRKVAGHIYKEEIPLTKADAFLYEHLSLEEKQRIERIVKARLGKLDEADIAALKQEDAFYYQKLSAEEKDRVDRLVRAYQKAKADNQDILLSEADAFYYQQLSYQNKQKLDRVIASHIHTQGAVDPDLANLNEEDRFFYEKLPAADKDRIDRMAKARQLARENGTDIALSQEDEFYYTHLSEQDKKIVDRITEKRSGSKINDPDITLLNEQDSFQYKQLPTTDKDRIEIKATNQKAGKITAEDVTLSNTENEQKQPSPNTFQMGDYNNVSISGKLIETATNLPATNIIIPLVDDKGKVIKTTTTGEDGGFKYINLPLVENYKILIETTPSRLTENTKYYIQDLRIVGYEQEALFVKLENIYFDFNKHILKTEDLTILDKLVALYVKFPDIQVEMNAFTDNIGSDEYNLILSEKRGRAVLDYLQNKGVSSSALVINARGKNNPTASNEDSLGRQSNRRVELNVKGGPLLYNQSTETYMAPTRTSLLQIAKVFDMTMEELKILNNLYSDYIEPYQPIKVRSRKAETPGNLDEYIKLEEKK